MLLHNDGGRFTDVSVAAGLTTASLGAAAGDFDNDGFIDLALTGPAGVTVLRNAGGKGFSDVSAATGADKLVGVFLAAAWADLDLDGDLDLVLTRYCADTTAAPAAIAGGPPPAGGGVVVLVNVGEAVPDAPRVSPPLSTKFQPAAGPGVAALLVDGPVTGVVVTDFDGDLDPDVIVFADGRPPAVVLNDRVLRFRRGPDLDGVPAGRVNGGLVCDANGDDQSDLALVPAAGPPVVRVSTRDDPQPDPAGRFGPGAVESPPLVQAQHFDLDRDGRPDLVGVTAGGRAGFVQSLGGGRFRHQPAAFGPAVDALTDLLAVAAADFDGDCAPDLLTWSAAGGVRLWRGRPTGYGAVLLAISGVREVRTPGSGRVLRVTADGIGTRAGATAGPVRAAVEFTTLSAGLGQSLGPVELGVGSARKADVVRFRWPDAVVQAELDQPACQIIKVPESSRKPTSCPLLLAWDGTNFAFVTDFLGAGALGEAGPDGAVRPPRPHEAVKIEPGRLAARDGRYVVKIADAMDEVVYLDACRLTVADHPADVAVFPDERFVTAGPQPSGELLAFAAADRVSPATATDHRGRDVTAALRDRDGVRVTDFAKRSWLGYAEDHAVTLDFGAGLTRLAGPRPVYLVLAGWTDYPYPESIYAATQAGVPTVGPTLDQRQPDGTWKPVADLGFPAGLPRVMTCDVSKAIDFAGGPLRIRTNLQIYWDQIYLCPAGPVESITLTPVRATLARRGLLREVTPPGGGPVGYDDAAFDPVAVTKWRGRFTRLGDVTPLLTALDDKLLVAGPGDEVVVEFAAGGLPALKPGWVRSFVVRADGFSKDTAPTTVTGGAVGPLPYRAMPAYPHPRPPAAWEAEWNTR